MPEPSRRRPLARFADALAGLGGGPPWRTPLLVALVAGLAYLPALGNGFVWDDHNNLVASDRLHDWSSVIEVFRRPAMWSAGRDGELASLTYRPIALASLALDYQLWGLVPAGFHLTSLLLHALVIGLLVRLLRRLLPTLQSGWLLAMCVGLHPASVEAVGWVNGRSEIFTLLGGLIALLAAAAPEPQPLLRRLVATLAGLLVALLGKETGLAFVPLALLVAAVAAPPGQRRRPLLAAGAGSLGALLFYAALRFAAVEQLGVLRRGVDSGVIAAAVPSLLARALQAVVWPRQRSLVMVGDWLRQLSTVGRLASLGLLLGLLVAAAWLLLRRRLLPLVGLLWVLGALAPLAMLAVVDWPGLHRWLYPALPGLALLVGGLLARRPPAPAVALLLVAVAAAELVLVERALPVWRSDRTLFRTMIDESPRSPYGYYALGIVLVRDGEHREAAPLLERSLALGATYRSTRPALGLAWAHLDRCAEARRIFDEPTVPAIPPPVYYRALVDCYRRRGDDAGRRDLAHACARRYPFCAAAERPR